MALPPLSERGIYLQNPDQNQGEPNLKPRRIEFRREMFPQDSIGFSLFPEILNGRKRPETTFHQPLSFIYEFGIFSGITVDRLKKMGLQTISDILYLPNEALFSKLRPEYRESVKDGLEKFFSNLTITPHAKLLGEIFREPQYPVPPEREQEIVDVVEKMLRLSNRLTLQEQEILAFRFGLNNGITHTQWQAGNIFGLPRKIIRQIEKEAFQKIRYSKKSKRELRQCLSLPLKSFGRELFGAVLWKDLPLLDAPIEELTFSDSTKSELLDLSLYPSNTGDLAKVDLEKYPLSPLARAEIKEILEDAASQSGSDDVKNADLIESWDSRLNLQNALSELLFGELEQEDRFNLNLMREMVLNAKNQGATTAEEIQDSLVKQNKDVMGIPPSSWRVRAFIEYILNHPEES